MNADFIAAIPHRIEGGFLEFRIGDVEHPTNCRSLKEFQRLVQARLDRNFPDGPKVIPAMTEEAIQSRGE